MGVLESTQRFNTSRWNKTKWYTLNEDVLAGLMGDVAISTEPEAVQTEAASLGAEVTLEGQQSRVIEGVESAPIDGDNRRRFSCRKIHR